MATDDLPDLGRPLRWVVMTGAGCSAESGLRTFREAGGLWEGHRPEDVATPMAWARDPAMVWRFYQARRSQLLEVEPNPAHAALARLEAAVIGAHGREDAVAAPLAGPPWPVEVGHADHRVEAWRDWAGDPFVLVTQNVDDLHQRAGSRRVLPMHGELRLLRCERCRHLVETLAPEDVEGDTGLPCPRCGDGERGPVEAVGMARLRPHVVWFHEQPLGMEHIAAAVEACDVLLVVGTSGVVYPAAAYVGLAQEVGARVIGVNLEPPENVGLFDVFHAGPAGTLLPPLVDAWVASMQPDG